LLKNVFHLKRQVYGIGDLVDPATVASKHMLEMLHISEADLRANETNFPARGAYLLSTTADKLGTWQVRGVAPFYSSGSVLDCDGSYIMEVVGEDRLYRVGLFWNRWTKRPDLSSTYIGYKLYKVRTGPRFTWLGRYPDGWIGKQARLTLFPEFTSYTMLHVATSKYTPYNVIRVFRAGSLVETVTLSAGMEHTFRLTCGEKPTEFRLEVERTFVPKKLRMNDDERELGVFTRLEPAKATRAAAAGQ
jgi:hypothetical protein